MSNQTTFEEIISDHNDSLIGIFNEHNQDPCSAISAMLSTSAKIDKLNRHTEKLIARMFDDAFLKQAKVSGDE